MIRLFSLLVLSASILASVCAADLDGAWTLTDMRTKGAADEQQMAELKKKIADMEDFLTRARLTKEELAKRQAIIKQERAKLEGLAQGVATRPVANGVTVTAQFKDGRMVGNSGCNQYQAQLKGGVDGKVAVGPVMGTRKMCPGAPMEVERSYKSILKSVTGYTVKADRLLLSTADGQGLIFRKDK